MVYGRLTLEIAVAKCKCRENPNTFLA